MQFSRHFFSVLALVLTITTLPCAQESDSQDNRPSATFLTVSPQFHSPSSLTLAVGAWWLTEGAVAMWESSDAALRAELHINDPANTLLLVGETSALEYLQELIKHLDVAPQQIEIEVRIVEISESKAQDIGLDWQRLILSSSARADWRYEESGVDQGRNDRQQGFQSDRYSESDAISRRFSAIATTGDVLDMVNILDQSGAGSVRVAPQILTLNNRQATILDGSRVTYVARYSSYTNLFETDSMDAGLTIRATPTVGSGGYITLDVNTEFTNLSGSISGSPIKRGQIIENTVLVRDGQSVLLGGLSRTIEHETHKRFPVLGHVLPFLFSRKITSFENIKTFIVLTPRIVELGAPLSPETQSVMEGD